MCEGGGESKGESVCRCHFSLPPLRHPGVVNGRLLQNRVAHPLVLLDHSVTSVSVGGKGRARW